MPKIIQNLKFGNKEVIISVGFFLTSDLLLLKKCSPIYVEAYEPREKIFKAYMNTAPGDSFHFIKAAVSGGYGEAILQEKSTKSTICSGSKNGTKVKTVSMTDIINRIHDTYGRIDRLLINCEGSELQIIDETPASCFGLCNYMFVQFHHWIDFINISQDDTDRCVAKLSKVFEVQLLHRKWAKYEFRRKR